MTLVKSFDAFDARGQRIVIHSWSGKLSVGRNASAARRPQCVGRSASAAMRRRSVGSDAADYVPTFSVDSQYTSMCKQQDKSIDATVL